MRGGKGVRTNKWICDAGFIMSSAWSKHFGRHLAKRLGRPLHQFYVHTLEVSREWIVACQWRKPNTSRNVNLTAKWKRDRYIDREREREREGKRYICIYNKKVSTTGYKSKSLLETQKKYCFTLYTTKKEMVCSHLVLGMHLLHASAFACPIRSVVV